MKFNAELITCIRQIIKADEYYPYTAHVGISKNAISAIKQHVHSEMQDIYGKDSVRYLTAKVGDLIVATTTCFHRGTKPEKADRTMLTLNYVMHPEEFKPPSYKIKKEDIEKLSNIKKPLVDYLIVE